MEIAAFALIGALIGSFINVVVWRLPRGESIVSPGSHCPGCDKPIAPYDNLPVVSWLLLRGRCRHCGTRISPRYPLIELTTALTFAAVVAVRGLDEGLVLELPFVACLIALAGIDFDHKLLPTRSSTRWPRLDWWPRCWSTGRPGREPDRGRRRLPLLFLAVLAYPRGMGMGDVKLAGAMGLYLGLSIIPAMLIAFLSGSIVGLAIMAREGAQARKKAVPFGVFLALGGIVAVLAGPELIELYEDNFLQ